MCVDVHELTSSCNSPLGGEAVAIMSLSNYKKLSMTGKLTVVRPGKGAGNYALIAYDSLPLKYQKSYDEKYGNPYDNYKESMVLSDIVTDNEARKFFATWENDGVTIPDELQDEYSRNADVLNLLISMLAKCRKMRNATQVSTQGMWESIYGTVDRLRVNPGHTLPENRARLRDKINAYKKDGYQVLISGKLGNKNTIKITEDAGMFLVMKKRCRVPVMSDKQIWLEFNRVAKNYGWKELRNEQSVTNYLNAPENMQRWYDAVYGELKAHQKFGYKFHTQLPEYRDALWYGDGTKLNLFYKAYEGGKLVVKTTQVYEVMDAYSETLLGYHISDSENYEAQYRSYRMAVEFSKTRPFEIVVDNQGGHKKLDTAGFLNRICRVNRNTTPYRGSGKTIENAFGRFQQQVLHEDWRFTGQNITATSQKSRANMEFILANKENLYTLDELKEAYAKARDKWNNMAHPATGQTRISMYLASHNDKATPVDRLDMIEMFWMMTAKPSTYTDSGITIKIDKKKYIYGVYAYGLPNFDFRKKHIGRKFFVQYDPLDLTQVRLYAIEASGLRYVADAVPEMKVQRALQDATHESSAFIRATLKKEKQLRAEQYNENVRLEHEWGVAPEQFGLNRSKIKGMNRKRKDNNSPQIITRKKQQETLDIGGWEKAISNLTEVDMLDKL